MIGHKKCSQYINNNVANPLENKFNFEDRDKDILLNELEEVFTKEDNEKNMKTPSKQEICKLYKHLTIMLHPDLMVWPAIFT